MADCINKTLIKKAKISFYAEDEVLVKLHNEAENIEEIYDDKNKELNLPLTTHFYKKRKDIDRSTLYSFKGPFQLLQADIADLRFLPRSAADPKCCLLVVDLFTQKICTYHMKKRTLLKKNLEQFYDNISKKRKLSQEMRLQTDQEFQ